jgi:hypothetical protein
VGFPAAQEKIMAGSSMHKLENPSRMIGLGASPSDNVVSSVLTCGFTQVPVIEYVTWTVDLPVPNEDVQATFGDEIDVLQNPKSVPGVTDVDSSFVINGILQVDMLVIGFGVHGFAEPQNGTQIGNYVNPAPTTGAIPISPDAFTQNDVATLGLADGQTITPALLEWGVCAQNALWHLMNAYQFQWIMQQRFLLINELAADVAYFGSYAEAVAAGSSQQAFQRYVNRVNNKYANLGDPGAFLPISAQRIGSVTGPVPGQGVFHPTRAYDTMDVTYGGLRVQGMTGTLQPFRKLFKPVLLERGIPVGMVLRVQDEYHQTQMMNYLAQVEPITAGGTHTLMPIGPGAIGGLSATALTELTFPDTAFPTTVLVEQQVQTDRVLLKGGALQLAILIKGFEIWGPWKQYILNHLVPAGVVGTAANH